MDMEGWSQDAETIIQPEYRLCRMEKKAGPQGIYYHVSFYDLQAANHITMLPNSVDFVEEELRQVMANGGNDFWADQLLQCQTPCVLSGCNP